MYSSDGLPQSYYDKVHNPVAMQELRNYVIATLECYEGDVDVDYIMQEVDPMLYDEVEEIVEEWKEQAHKDILRVLEEGV